MWFERRTSSLGSVEFAARVLLPFSAAHFLSYVLRTINAILAPSLVTQVSLDAGQLGVLTSAYFLAFGLAQLPVGMLLDRFGPRQVQGILLILAALGCFWFGLAHSFAEMVAARALTGFGLAACYMAALKVTSEWVSPSRIPTMSGVFIAVGGVGAIASTMPAQYALETIGQNNLFFAIGAAIVVSWLMIVVVAPEPLSRDRGAPPSLRSLLDVYRNKAFQRPVRVALIPHTVYFAIQGLWLGPWLNDVAGFTPRVTAMHLFAGMAAMVVTTVVVGRAAEWATDRGHQSLDIAAAGLWIFALVQVLIVLDARSFASLIAIGFPVFGAFAQLEFAIVAQSVPRSLTGRATTCLNILVFLGSFFVQAGFGAILSLFVKPGGSYPTIAYQVAFAVLLILQLPGLLLWLFELTRRMRALRLKQENRVSEIASAD